MRASSVPAIGRSRLMAMVALFHPGPSLATVLAAVLCARSLPVEQDIGVLVAIGVMVALQQAAVSVHNDWCDRDLDALAKPDRALPLGVISPRATLYLAAALTVASFAVALPLGWKVVALNAAFLVSAAVYSARLKRTPWSWLPFATGFPSIALYGCGAYDFWPPEWWAVYVAGAPLSLAVHLTDTLPDLEADTAAGVRGLAHALGPDRSKLVAVMCLVAVGALTAATGFLRDVPFATAMGIAALGCVVEGTIRPRTSRIALTFAALLGAVGWVAAVLR